MNRYGGSSEREKKKERLDVLLVKRGLAESREKAKAIIMTGNVLLRNNAKIKREVRLQKMRRSASRERR